jgi:hypothetical protein
MNKWEMQSEVTRLRAQQLKARNAEGFGGLSSEERTAYNTRANRIRELDELLEKNVVADQASAEQRRELDEQPESDTPQSEAARIP